MLRRFLIVGALFLGTAAVMLPWRLLLFMGYVVFFWSCDNEITQEAVSPGGKLRAVLFVRNCGATTGFQTQVSIVNHWDDLPDRPANVFIAEGRPETMQTKLRWLDETTLVIVTTAYKSAHKAERQLRNVTVNYENP